MVADVVSALAFFVLNIVVAIAMVMVTVRVITLFTNTVGSDRTCASRSASSVKAVRHLSASLTAEPPHRARVRPRAREYGRGG